MLTRGKSRRTSTGAKRTFPRKKKKVQIRRETLLTRVGDSQRKKLIKTRGGNRKHRATLVNVANVIDPKSGKSKTVKITGVAENPANIQYVKRNILNKSAIIETELGKARVTSRPSQTGVVNAVLLKE